MGIVTEAGAGDRQDRGQDDCPPSPLAWLIRGCRSVSSRAYPCHERRARRSRARPSGELSGLTVTHIFLLWAKDLISLADPAALGGRARERTCSMKPVIGPRPSSGRPTLGMPDAPTVS